MTSRSWCLTLYAARWIDAVRGGNVQLPEGFKFFEGQLEECPDTGRLHVQAWAMTNSPVRMRRVKRYLDDNAAHVEKMHGTWEESRAYCTDAEKRVAGTEPFSVGTEPRANQGRRTDLLAVREKILAGASMDDLFKDESTFEPAVRYTRGLQAAVRALQPPANRSQTTVQALVGPPGTGKTRAVHEREPDLYTVDPPNSFGGPVWWDGYAGQEAVLLDDYEGWMPWSQLLRVLDRYPLSVQAKGSSVPLRATRLYLTSNKMPWEWHPKRLYPALGRRISTLWYCDHDVFRQMDPRSAPDNVTVTEVLGNTAQHFSVAAGAAGSGFW